MKLYIIVLVIYALGVCSIGWWANKEVRDVSQVMGQAYVDLQKNLDREEF